MKKIILNENNIKQLYKKLLKESETVTNEYACLMLECKSELWDKYKTKIDKDDLYIEGNEYGLEKECHITLLYGIHDNVTLKDVKEHVKPLNQYKIKITDVSLFENKQYDVLKFDIECGIAQETYKELKENIPNTQTYKTYKPHMTIAYLKPGKGKKYIESIPQQKVFTPYEFSFYHPSNKKNYFKK